MTLRYLLDTDTVSETSKPKDKRNPQVIAQLDEHSHESAIAIAVLHEIYYGIEHKRPGSTRRMALELWLQGVVATYRVLPYDDKAARWHAAERVRLKRIGEPRGFPDGMIAAVAATNGLVVVTRNETHFGPFDVEVESWFS